MLFACVVSSTIDSIRQVNGLITAGNFLESNFCDVLIQKFPCLLNEEFPRLQINSKSAAAIKAKTFIFRAECNDLGDLVVYFPFNLMTSTALGCITPQKATKV
jgi:hypothetical protein